VFADVVHDVLNQRFGFLVETHDVLLNGVALLCQVLQLIVKLLLLRLCGVSRGAQHLVLLAKLFIFVLDVFHLTIEVFQLGLGLPKVFEEFNGIFSLLLDAGLVAV
jgi:hypothetical protein